MEVDNPGGRKRFPRIAHQKNWKGIKCEGVPCSRKTVIVCKKRGEAKRWGGHCWLAT